MVSVARNANLVTLKILTVQQTLENTVYHVNLESTWIMPILWMSVRDVLHVTASLVFGLKRIVTENRTQNAPVQRTIFAVLYHVLRIASHVPHVEVPQLKKNVLQLQTLCAEWKECHHGALQLWSYL